MMRRPVSLSAPFAVRGRRRATRGRAIEVRPGRDIGLGYDDHDVLEMAARDGQAGFNASPWGQGNRETRGLLAVMFTGNTHGAAIRVRLEEELAGIAVAYAHARERFQTYRNAACDAQMRVVEQVVRRRNLTKKLDEHCLDEPMSRWPVMLLLLLLAMGDLTMTAAAMAVFNLSDARFVGWLPFSELHLAAVPIVVGMLASAHFLGESLKAHRYEKEQRSVLKIVAGASLAGGLCLALSIAAVRSAFLNANGVPASSGAFVGVQLGLLLAAVAASTWAAHPYGPAWRQMERRAGLANRRYGRARWRVGQQATVVNALVEQFRRRVWAARAGVEVVSSDVVRQGHLYIRELQHGQPEPTEEALYPGELPSPARPQTVEELLNYPDGAKDSSLIAPEPVNLDDLDDAWEKLRRQCLNGKEPPADASVDSEGPEPTPLHPVADGTDTSPEPGAA